MRSWSGPQPADSLAGWYGPDGQCFGIITDHIHLLDGEVRDLDGYAYAISKYDSKHFAVLCSEIIRVDTEDGPSDGRCGENVRTGQYTCDMHAHYQHLDAEDGFGVEDPYDFEGWI